MNKTIIRIQHSITGNGIHVSFDETKSIEHCVLLSNTNEFIDRHDKFPTPYEEKLDVRLHGYKIYQKNPNGYEYHSKYDKRGNLIYYKNSNGYEYHSKYDKRGNVIYRKTPEKKQIFH